MPLEGNCQFHFMGNGYFETEGRERRKSLSTSTYLVRPSSSLHRRSHKVVDEFAETKVSILPASSDCAGILLWSHLLWQCYFSKRARGAVIVICRWCAHYQRRSSVLIYCLISSRSCMCAFQIHIAIILPACNKMLRWDAHKVKYYDKFLLLCC